MPDELTIAAYITTYTSNVESSQQIDHVLHSYNAPAAFKRAGSSDFFACSSEFPPMCFWAMKTLGTVRWLVISWSAFWIAEPSSMISRRQS